jgi:hypothetical protein
VKFNGCRCKATQAVPVEASVPLQAAYSRITGCQFIGSCDVVPVEAVAQFERAGARHGKGVSTGFRELELGEIRQLHTIKLPPSLTPQRHIAQHPYTLSSFLTCQPRSEGVLLGTARGLIENWPFPYQAIPTSTSRVIRHRSWCLLLAAILFKVVSGL